MSKLYVGIDISKDRSSANGIDERGRNRFELSFDMDGTGFAELLEAIEANSDSYENVVAAMESTACYHINLYSFLSAKGIEAVVINPLLIANFAKLSLRKTKTDKKDASTIAQFILAHKDSVTQLAVSQDMQDIRDMARERESLCHQISATKVEIRRLLHTTFPELESMCNPFTKVMLHFIQRFPSARLVSMAKANIIAKTLKEKPCSCRIRFTPSELVKISQRSIATVSPGKEIILSGKIDTLLHLQKRRDELTKALTKYCESSIVEDLKIVTSIAGIGNNTATTFLAETGRIDNYASHKNLIAFAGIDPTVYQSGKYEGASKISKRGNRHLRRVIWIMTVRVINHNPTFRKYFFKKRNEGQPFKKAVFATAHKLVRVIFAMLSHRTCFQEECI
ncbi:MAG: IS110 family transposase [Nitrospirota bacterium]|nr:IS110 family transposase [Nitrospirota bacterium]